MKYPAVNIKRYDTFKECFMEFLGVDESELPNTYWMGNDGEKDYEVPALEVLETPTAWCDECWGFARFDENTMHIWVGDNAKMEDVIGLIAHELAHLERPKYKNAQKEEAKAGRAGINAQFAYYNARNLLGL